MTARSPIKSKLKTEVNQWIDQLVTSTGKVKCQAAAELSRLGVWTRGSVRPRGTIEQPARNELPEPDRLQEVVGLLESTDKDVRRHVASALGEWGDEKAAKALCKILDSEPDEDVRLSCITALRTIGGPTATDALRQAVENGTEPVRNAALGAIEELATGGRVEDAEAPMRMSANLSSKRPATGTVRARAGITRPAAKRNVIDRLAATLEHVRADNTASEYLRHKATDVLAVFAAGE